MAGSGARVGFILKHLLRVQSRFLVPAIQNSTLTRNHLFEPCVSKPTSVNLISTSAAVCKDKSKYKEKSKAKIMKLDDKELGQYVDVPKIRSQFHAEVEKLKQFYVQQLSIRSSVGIIESMKIDFEGKSYELQDLAQVAKKGKNILAVNMAGFPQAAVSVMKSLRSSTLGLNPTQDGTLITVQLPRTTKEHRENLAKQAKAAYVDFKKVVDRVVDTQNKNVKKQEGLSKDEILRIYALLRLLENEYLQIAEAALKTKQDELKLED